MLLGTVDGSKLGSAVFPTVIFGGMHTDAFKASDADSVKLSFKMTSSIVVSISSFCAKLILDTTKVMRHVDIKPSDFVKL